MSEEEGQMQDDEKFTVWNTSITLQKPFISSLSSMNTAQYTQEMNSIWNYGHCGF